MSEQMKPCPFCGSADIRRDIGWLECNSCGCYGPNAEVNDDDTISLSAIAAWNQRAMDENVDAELTALRNRVEEWPACYSCDFHKQHENTILGTIDDCLSGQDVDVAEVMQGENCPHWQNEKREDGLLRLQHRLIEKEAELVALRARIEIAQSIIQEPFRDYLTEAEWNESKLERLAQAIWGEPVKDDLEASDD